MFSERARQKIQVQKHKINGVRSQGSASIEGAH